MRQPFVAGNWKMNGSRKANRSLLGAITAGIGSVVAEVAVCPPCVYLSDVAEQLAGTSIAWGAQNVSAEPRGAFTGETSVSMLLDVACRYVIVGHSERRALYGEDDGTVARKFAAAKVGKIVPILCVGESLEERERGATEDVIARQLDAVLELEGVTALREAVIAYEPVWAIGTGKTATPEQAQGVHAFIRKRVAQHDQGVADKVRILYGGSVKGNNAVELFAQEDIDGGLIGGASLDAEEFLTICRATG